MAGKPLAWRTLTVLTLMDKDQSMIVPLTMLYNIFSALYQLHEGDISSIQYTSRYFLERCEISTFMLPTLCWSRLARDIPH